MLVVSSIHALVPVDRVVPVIQVTPAVQVERVGLVDHQAGYAMDKQEMID